MQTFTKAFRRACEAAGIPYGRNRKDGITFHSLRHSYVTNARREKIPESVIMAMTGHKTRAMLLRYDTVDERDLKKAAELLTRSLTTKKKG